MNFKEFAGKKVFGIPVLYLIGAAVIIFAVIAFKMKPSKDAAEETPPDAGGPDETAKDPYDAFETNGTVVVQPAPATPDPNLANASIETNQAWLSKGVQFLVSEKNVTGTVASTALTKYLNGQDRSYAEEEYVNVVIKELGPPPDGVDTGGSVSSKPATKQFTSFPGVHKIVGGSDNNYAALAALYYNSTAQDRIDLLQAANVDLGRNGPWAEGTQVKIPAYIAPKYYVTSSNKTKRETASQVAAKNGITLTQLAYLNNPPNEAYAPNYAFNPSQRVRVA